MERPADRGRRRHVPQSAERPEHQREADQKASGERSDNETKRAGG